MQSPSGAIFHLFSQNHTHTYTHTQTLPYNDDIKPSAELSAPCVGGPVLSLMPSHCHPSTCASLSEQILASSFCPGALLFIATSTNGISHWLWGQLQTAALGNWRLSIGMHLSFLHARGLRKRLYTHVVGSFYVSNNSGDIFPIFSCWSYYIVLFLEAKIRVWMIREQQNLKKMWNRFSQSS